MKLAAKIAVAVTLVIAVLLGLDGLFRVQSQLETFEKDTRRDHLSMGRAAAAAVAESWRSHGEPLAMELIERICRKGARVSIHWVDAAAMGTGRSLVRLTEDEARTLASGEAVSVVRGDGDGAPRMVTFVPVLPNGAYAGAIQISEPLSAPSGEVKRIILRTAAITSLAVLVCAGATLLLGFLFIARPIRRLVKQAVAIGQGNFDDRPSLHRNDEIGDLAMEMNTMATKLKDAVQRMESETKAHLETLAQLRHADRLKTVGQLTSSVVHEVGTPLTVIAGRAKMIQSAEVEGDEARECARIVVEQAERVTRTVRQILDFARAGLPERRTQDIRAVALQMVELLNPVAVKNGIYLDIARDDVPALARIDTHQIQQVLANVIINAIQASGSGDHVTVAVEAEEMAPPNRPPRGTTSIWTLSVRDEGCGIPEESIPRIFESFYTTKTQGAGTGLGLAISKEIIRDHGGWISVESAVDEGSVFRIHLPAEKDWQ